MKTTRTLTFIFTAITLSLTSGCFKTRAQMKRESTEKEQQQAEALHQAEVAEVQANTRMVDELRAEIQRMGSKMDELQKQNIELSRNIDKTNQKNAEVEVLKSKISELEASQAALIEALRKKEKEKEVPKAESADLYEQGKAAYEAKKYDTAADAFQDYLKFPKAKFSENAHFMKAESHYQLGQYKKAIIDYSVILEKFPKSKKAATCLYKTALSFDGLGMKQDAKTFYQELVDKYPKSSEAKKALSKLK